MAERGTNSLQQKVLRIEQKSAGKKGSLLNMDGKSPNPTLLKKMERK